MHRILLPIFLACLLASCASSTPRAPSLRGLSLRDKTALVSDPDPSVRLNALQSLASDARKASPPVRSGIIQLFTDRLSVEPAPLLRQSLVSALSALARPRALPAYLKALEDDSPTVRLEAVHALRDASDPAALEPLRRSLASDPDDRVRADALSAYVSLADPDDATVLLQGVIRDPSDAVAIRARSELARLMKKTPNAPRPAQP
ncbi:MAG: HEAT repeat domain-containing protein [Planctomycetota bacterium]